MERRAVDVDDLIQDYLAGTSINKLAKRWKVSRIVIYHRLREQSVPIRGRGEAERLKWAQMDGVARRRQIQAAHRAACGRKATFEERTLRAVTMQRLGHLNPVEQRLANWLAEHGIGTIAQQAIGPYNCDLGAHPVAVEIFGGQWHFSDRHLARLPQRVRYLFDAGWHQLVVVVDSRRYPLHPSIAEELAGFIKRARRHPSAVREYRMLRGAGEVLAACRADDDDLSVVPAFTLGRNPLTGRYQRVP